MRSFILAKGRPYSKKIWGAEFCLLPNKFLFNFLALRIGFGLCLFKKIDVIVAQSPLFEGFIGALLKKFFRKTDLIVEAHGDWDSIFLVRKRRWEKLQRKIVKFFVKTSFKKADKVRVVAQYLLEKTKRLAPEKPHFIFPTFTDLDSFLGEKDAKLGRYVLFAGGLYKIKGVECLIEAIQLLSLRDGRRPDLRQSAEIGSPQLVIVGDGPEMDQLKVQGEKLKMEKKIEFKGRLSLAETKEIMKNCYCLIVPSLSEGLPRVILEAMALSKPVIASNVGGIPDVVQDKQTGFLFEKGNSRDLAEKLRILLNNKDLARQMGQKARQLVKQRFSNKRYIDNYLKMLNV